MLDVKRIGLLPWLSGKKSACVAGDAGSVPGLGRSPGEGNGIPLQYSCLGNPLDRGGWGATDHGVTKSRTRLSDCDPMDCSTPSFPVLHCLLEFAQTLVHWVGDVIQPSHPLSPSSPLALSLSVFPSIRVFSRELALRVRWPEYWSFSFSISPSNEYSGLISFRIDWFDLLTVQETLRSLLQYLSLVLGLLYGPTLRSVHDYWKNHSFD